MGGQVEQQCDRGTPFLLGSTGVPCIRILLIAMGLVGWEAVAVGASGFSLAKHC
jgi:hypothetical protein